MKKLGWLFLSLVVTGVAFPLSLKIDEWAVELPIGWKLRQETKSEEVELLGFENQEEYLQVYVVPKTNKKGRKILNTSNIQVGRTLTWAPLESHAWEIKELDFNGLKTLTAFSETPRAYLILTLRGSPSAELEQMKTILSGIKPLDSESRSLTGPDFSGRKYYLGFGDYLSGFMGNEVKYDIAHTHDVFTSEVGGDYEGVKVHGANQGKTKLIAEWEALGKIMTEKDMYVQYSSGHGSKTGLAFGPSYREIRDNALSYPAKEIIIFTMACYSGNLVEAFNQKKSEWQDWNKQGRTLMVMASSQPSQTSSTGPGYDPEEPGGPAGSAGSAFGHALWKALIGHSDGQIDGIKDGFLSLAEIREYSKKRTQQLGGHTPITTGSYNENLLMAKVPSEEWLRKFDQGTTGLNDEQIIEKIREIDGELGR